MPPISAILHTHNDERRLGRALETLRPCDEVIVVDSGSTDRTLALARDYAAVIIQHRSGDDAWLAAAKHDWLLHLSPRESLSELLEAELYEWRLIEPAARVFAIPIRQQAADGLWQQCPPQLRLLHRHVALPGSSNATPLEAKLEGHILRFNFPE